MLWVRPVEGGVMLCNPADRVAGVPNMPLAITLLSSLDERTYIVCSFAPCDHRYFFGSGSFRDRHERMVCWIIIHQTLPKEHHSDRHDQTSRRPKSNTYPLGRRNV
jgi:hypothetical protein